MKEHEIAIRQETLPQLPEPPDPLTAIIAAVTRGDMPVETMERLVALSERMMETQRKTAFMAAMARLTEKVAPIEKNGTSHHGAYMLLEDIDLAIRPLLASEGMSLSFDSQPSEKNVRVTCKLSHAEGHSETKQIDLPLDTSGSKNPAQAVLSTVKYARRALVTMWFNLQGAGQDMDGNDPSTITQEQVREIETLLQDTKTSKESLFAKIVTAEDNKIENILARDYGRVMNALNTKARTQK